MEELYRLYFKAETIFSSDMSWEAKYDMIFSKDISRKVFDIAPGFNYYDPDTSYEEDVTAFFNSFKEYLWVGKLPESV